MLAEHVPTQGPSAATLLEAIAGANNVGAIEALRSDLVERRGDQAWTDELVAATRKRAEQLGELPISQGAAGSVFRRGRRDGTAAGCRWR